MKKLFITLTFICFYLYSPLFAQRGQGIVKSKGRKIGVSEVGLQKGTVESFVGWPKYLTGTPKHFLVQEINTALAYSRNYTSFMQVGLDMPLQAGKTYEIGMMVLKYPHLPKFSVNNSLRYATVSFSTKKLLDSLREDKNTTKVNGLVNFPRSTKPYIALASKEFPILNSIDSWMPVKGYYTAIGGERYITISDYGNANRACFGNAAMKDSSIAYIYADVYAMEVDGAPTSKAVENDPYVKTEAKPANKPVTKPSITGTYASSGSKFQQGKISSTINKNKPEPILTVGNNLIPNPGFEIYDTTRIKKGETAKSFGIVLGWFSPTNGSPDYFSRKHKNTYSPQSTWNVDYPTHGGQASVGLFLFSSQVREYLRVKLAKSLEKGRRYNISAFVLFNTFYSSHITSNIGFSFDSTDVREIHSPGEFLALKPEVQNPKNQLLKDTSQWTPVSGTFVANGSEQFMTIGNFFDITETTLAKRYDKGGHNKAFPNDSYVFIDDVSLIADTSKTPVVETPQMDESYVFYFTKGSSTMQPNDLDKLTELSAKLSKAPNQVVRVVGYNDNPPDPKITKSLGVLRAKAVTEFMEQLGVQRSRIVYRTAGPTEIATIDDSEASKNKFTGRVEVLLTRQK